jgi:hypothetical protein
VSTASPTSTPCRHDEAVQLYAFDIMALDGEDDLSRSPAVHAQDQPGFFLGTAAASIRQSNTEYNMQAPLCAQRSSRPEKFGLGYPLKPFH